MTTMMAWLLGVILFAAPSELVSRAHFVRAQRLFAQHDWRRALDEFTVANESAPSELPELSFDIAQCHRNLGHARQAVLAFEHYLILKPDASDKQKVRLLIAQLGGRAADDAAATGVADATATATTPTDAAAAAAAAAAAGAPTASQESAPVTGAASASAPLTAPSLAAPATMTLDARLTAAAPAPPARSHRHWKLWTGVAVGVALVAVGVGVGVGVGLHPGDAAAGQPPPMLGSAATFDTRGH